MFFSLKVAYEMLNGNQTLHFVNTPSFGLAVQSLKPVVSPSLRSLRGPTSNEITVCFHSDRSAKRESHKAQWGRGFRGRDN